LWPVAAAQFLKTRVSPETKRRAQELARQQLLTESIWLRQVINAALSAAPSPNAHTGAPAHEPARGERLYVRLGPEDRLLLKERASARGMAAATYMSVLARAHLRNLSPLPRDELLALRQAVAELGAIGRNLNQIAHVANRRGRIVGPGQDELRSFLKVCEAIRVHVKGLLRANLASWVLGHDEAAR
jgi:predicted transcriptional regulator